MIDPKRKQALLKRQQREHRAVIKFLVWPLWGNRAESYPELDQAQSLSRSYRCTLHGKRLRLATQICAALNFLFVVLAVVDFFVFTKDDGTTIYDVMKLVGLLSKWLYVLTTVLMLVAFGLAKRANEFQPAKYDAEAEHVITQVWVLLSSLVFMFVIVIQFAMLFDM